MTEATEPAYPYVAVCVQAAGIHPTTGRLLTLDAVTFDDAGRVGEEFHQVFNPGCDPGPRHTHGLSPSDFAQAPRFGRCLRTLDKLIDTRTLVLHDAPHDWGFIVSEARRAMNAAARANRSRSRRGTKRRQRVGHVPKPASIVDLLASARALGHVPVDTRLAPLAELVGVEPAVAEAAGDAAAHARAQTLTLVGMFLGLKGEGDVVTRDAQTLTADRFGLQRSALRVEADATTSAADNPGTYSAAGGMRKGMEFVVTDDVSVCPDTLIDLGVRAGLTYAEKLTRQTSVVVSDAVEKGVELRGKAMHGHRKNIPILSASQFVAAVKETDFDDE